MCVFEPCQFLAGLCERKIFFFGRSVMTVPMWIDMSERMTTMVVVYVFNRYWKESRENVLCAGL